ncbi:unnamed protein product, partial [Owenia fusiformis]
MMNPILSISFVLMCTAVCATVAEESACLGEDTRCLNQTCGEDKKCPNTFTCRKGICCRFKTYRDCGAIMRHACKNIPKKCRGGGSESCPESTKCYQAKSNLFSMCCPINASCTDETGVDHSPTDEPWISNYDKCSKCQCLKNGMIKCKSRRKTCHRCEVTIDGSVKRFKRGEVYWKNCKKFTCISPNRSVAVGPCGSGKKGPPVFTPLATTRGGCIRQARITICYYSASVVGHRAECSNAVDHEIEIITSATHRDACPKPGKRISEGTSVIIGGNKVSPEFNYKWMVHLDLPTGRCGGSIISPRHILTAAHCVDMRNGEIFTVYTGKHNLAVDEPFQQNRTVTVTRGSNVIIHEGYNKTTLNNDIAIIVVGPPLLFNEVTQPISLPSSHDLEQDSFCAVIGWGVASERSITESNSGINPGATPHSNVLLEAPLNNFECDIPSNPGARSVNTETMFCASDFPKNARKRKDSCKGD